ncbi:uncharacterized protein LOC112495005 isoform X2 [Cephus cinctus]|uniref:Uncharacterized protein LOC112495005 isoform X2 n=1 Tax=Cephus cinctus TaxID=211228 RepID=A0AAJ7RR82_CEPCN|nr:uncharacterized protein LOC112495005 isoform X2 [Cephus cinctus]
METIPALRAAFNILLDRKNDWYQVKQNTFLPSEDVKWTSNFMGMLVDSTEMKKSYCQRVTVQPSCAPISLTADKHSFAKTTSTYDVVYGDDVNTL